MSESKYEIVLAVMGDGEWTSGDLAKHDRIRAVVAPSGGYIDGSSVVPILRELLHRGAIKRAGGVPYRYRRVPS